MRLAHRLYEPGSSTNSRAPQQKRFPLEAADYKLTASQRKEHKRQRHMKSKPDVRPDIIFFFTDQQRWDTC
ncbi:MAG: hypothetical protein ACYTF6_05115, partial [Planctomycetota bacterium]